MASGASEENFAFLTTKYDQMAKLEHLICPKVWGGGRNPLVLPTFESGRGVHKPPPAPPPSYALDIRSLYTIFVQKSYQMLKLSKCRQRDREKNRTKYLVLGLQNERHDAPSLCSVPIPCITFYNSYFYWYVR